MSFKLYILKKKKKDLMLDCIATRGLNIIEIKLAPCFGVGGAEEGRGRGKFFSLCVYR